jgi:ATP/maltotriose-dependent transcriptional regulator MalT
MAQALDVARGVEDGMFTADLYLNAASVAHSRGELDDAASLLSRAHELSLQAGSIRDIAHALKELGQVNRGRLELGLARAQFEEALATFEGLEDDTNVAELRYRLGELSVREGDLDGARKPLEESLNRWLDSGHAFGEAATRLTIGHLELLSGDRAAAGEHVALGLESFVAVGYPQGIAEAIDCVAALALADGGAQLAAELQGAADGIRRRIGAAIPASTDRIPDPVALEASLGEQYPVAHAAGEALDDDAAIELARRTCAGEAP